MTRPPPPYGGAGAVSLSSSFGHAEHNARAPEFQPFVAAVRYAARGWPVFPVKPQGKTPLTKRGFLDATTDPERAFAWWRLHPNANIGLAVGKVAGFWVLDVDRPDSLAELEREHGPLPETAQALTGGGGVHLFFKMPDRDVRNSAGKVAVGIDVRGSGGYVVAPPSLHPSGQHYTWNRSHRGLAEAPDWLLRLMFPPPPPPREVKPLSGDINRYAAVAADRELAILGAAREGQRNHALNRSAFCLAQLVKGGVLPEAWTKGALEARAVSLGLPVPEIQKTINSAFRAAQPRVISR